MEESFNKESKYYVENENFERTFVPGFTKGFKVKDGIFLSNMFRNMSIIKNLPVKKGDIFVVTYPKSGTTWTEEIVWLMKNNLDYATAKSQLHFKRISFIDTGISHNYLDEIPTPRVLKSHLPVQFLPDNLNKRAKIVYCLRNPKDMLVSTYKFTKSLINDEFDGTFEDLFNLFMQDKIWFGPWDNHVDGFTSLENVHVVHYENLLKNPLEEFKLLAKYLEVEYTDEQLLELIEFTSFKSMKDYIKFYANEAEGSKHFKGDLTFFRKGQIGDWNNYFNDEMSKKLEESIGKRLKYKGKLTYDP